MKGFNLNQRSRFICLWCQEENMLGRDLQRSKIRERLHIKNMYCIRCKCKTPNVEVRSCDYFKDIMEEVPDLALKYPKVETILG